MKKSGPTSDSSKTMTISDIAREAGVSIATVSRMLSGKGPVRDSTRQKIEYLIRQYSYDSRLLSRGFKRERTRIIGCIVQQLGHPYFVQTCAALETTCRDNDMAMLLGVATDKPEIEENIIHLFLEKKVDGLVIMGGSANFPEPSDRFKALLAGAADQCPVIFINGYYYAEGIGQVQTDEKAGMLELLNRIYAQGHRKTAFIGGEYGSGAARNRLETYLNWARNQNLELQNDWILESGFSAESGMKAMAELLSWKQPPTAVVCANDLVAAGALKTTYQRGYKVPEEISIVGFDGSELTDLSFPKISTVGHDYYGLARAAVASLDAALSQEMPPGRIMLPAIQIEGETLGPVPV